MTRMQRLSSCQSTLNPCNSSAKFKATRYIEWLFFFFLKEHGFISHLSLWFCVINKKSIMVGKGYVAVYQCSLGAVVQMLLFAEKIRKAQTLSLEREWERSRPGPVCIKNFLFLHTQGLIFYWVGWYHRWAPASLVVRLKRANHYLLITMAQHWKPL